MAKRRKTSRKKASKPAANKAAKPAASSGLIEVAERAVLAQSGKVLAAATNRYKRFVRQAAKATNDANKRKYLVAALSAVAIAGVVANDLRRRLDNRPVAKGARKKRI